MAKTTEHPPSVDQWLALTKRFLIAEIRKMGLADTIALLGAARDAVHRAHSLPAYETMQERGVRLNRSLRRATTRKRARSSKARTRTKSSNG